MGKSTLVGVTGTPGAGKSTFARRLAKATGFSLLEVNSVIESDRALYRLSGSGEKIARLLPLGRRIRKLVKGNNTVLVGHLVQDLELKYDCIIVVRHGIADLMKRLSARGYGKPKIRENLVCEALDCCGVKAAEIAREVFEVETEREKARMLSMMRSGRWRTTKDLTSQKDKMREFERFISKNRGIGL